MERHSLKIGRVKAFSGRKEKVRRGRMREGGLLAESKIELNKLQVL